MCVLSLAFCIAFAMASGVADSGVNWLPSFKPLWYELAEQCCTHELSIRDTDEHSYDRQLLRECIVVHNYASPFSTCEPDLCFAVKKGYASENGVINKETLQILLEVELQHNLPTLAKILEDCVYGDLFKYPMGMCEMKKMNMCISVHVQEEVLRGCSDWKDHFSCIRMRIQVTRNIKNYLPQNSIRLDNVQLLQPQKGVTDSIDALIQRLAH